MKTIEEAIRAVCPYVDKYLIGDLSITEGQAIRMLQAERRRVRALVRKVRGSNPFLGTATVGYDTACDDILAALEGKP